MERSDLSRLVWFVRLSLIMRRVFLFFLVPLIVGVVLGVLEFVSFESYPHMPRLPGAIAVALCVLVVAAGSVVARAKLGKPWLPLGWTFVIMFILFAILSSSDLSLPLYLTSNALLINAVLLVVVGIWVLIRAKRG